MSKYLGAHRSPYAAFSGPNLGYVMEMYELFKTSPDSVEAELAEMFRRFGAPEMISGEQTTDVSAVVPGDFGKVLSAYRLLDAIRT